VKYLMLIYETEKAFGDREGEPDSDFWGAWRGYTQALLDSGMYVGGSPLEPPVSAATVRMEGSKRVVPDGPFADTKEQLGGYILMDVPSLEEALDWAARCPASRYGCVEVRPISTAVEERVFGERRPIADRR
jgi:hypothetical protein